MRVSPRSSRSVPTGRAGGCVALGLVWTVVAGCVVGPDYEPPAPTVPDAWYAAPPGGAAPAPELSRWWERMDDPVLVELVERALSGSPELDLARARLREARARLGAVEGEALPEIGSNVGGGYALFSEASTGIDRDPAGLYRVGLDASWEVDLFGRVRRSVEAAEADLLAVHLDLADVQVSLAAETAVAWVELCTAEQRLAGSAAEVDALAALDGLVAARFDAGLAGSLERERARAELARVRAAVPARRAERAHALHRLGVLLGRAPGAPLELERADAPRPIPTAPASIAVGIPAEALRRRPDVRRAERELAAATARTGVATADLYPRLRLLGSVGLEAIQIKELATGDAAYFDVGPELRLPLFDRARLYALLDVEEARTQQALHRHRIAVLGALAEVEDGLRDFQEERARLDTLAEAVEAARVAIERATELEKAGLRDLSELLEVRRVALELEDERALSAGQLAITTIRLFKALGGGWEPMPIPDGRAGTEAE